MKTDWLPSRREEQLALAQSWTGILQAKSSEWGIPETVTTALDGLVTAAYGIFLQSQSSERNAVITAQCKAAFDQLIALMRDTKNRYFLEPPLTNVDLAALGLKPKAIRHSRIAHHHNRGAATHSQANRRACLSRHPRGGAGQNRLHRNPFAGPPL